MTVAVGTTGNFQSLTSADNWPEPVVGFTREAGRLGRSPRSLELLEELIAASTSDDGLDWDALASVNRDAWGIQDENDPNE